MAEARAMKPAERHEFFRRLREFNPHPKSDLEYRSAFELLVAVILSAQATDKSVNIATKKLFAVANTPETIQALGEDALIEYIRTIGLFRTKAKNVIAMCKLLIEQHGSQVPDSDRLDVSRDGNISALDALQVINDLIVGGSHATPQVAGNAKLYLDTSLDGQISPLDALQVINYLVSHSPGVATSQGLTSQSLAATVTPLATTFLPPAGPSNASAAVAFGLSVSSNASSTSGVASSAISPAPADLVYGQLASNANSATSVLEPDDESGSLAGTKADGASPSDDWYWLS